ncbi:MAG: YjbQ family protein [Chloroflexi bacterium]|nr:MAG: YjbQ family protein [Chloroflexota bacterium]
MAVDWESFRVRTERRVQLLDVTRKVAQLVERAEVVDGVCYVFVPHTTAGVTINEAAEPDVARDIEAQLGRMVPKDAHYRHSEGNSDSHIKTVLVGPTVTAPVRQGKLSLGTWQAVFLCEWDGPRTRTIEVRVID